MKKYMKEIILLIVCIAVFSGAVCALIAIWNMYHRGQAEYENLKDYVRDPEGETESEPDIGIGAGQIDFEGLKALNPDIVAWIRCEELGVDYPVVLGKDNDYYLHRTFTGEEHIAGCIFMDYRNHADFSDHRTILYGHNMKDGSMFGSLKDYSSGLQDIFLCVFLPDKTVKYKVVGSAYVPSNDECYRLEGTGETGLKGSERELLLSTCTGDSATRLVIHCAEGENVD